MKSTGNIVMKTMRIYRKKVHDMKIGLKYNDDRQYNLFEVVNKYNIVPDEMVVKAYESLRGNQECAYVVANLYENSGPEKIACGNINKRGLYGPSSRNDKHAQTKLFEALEEHKYSAFSVMSNPWDYLVCKDDEMSILYVKDADSLTGCGWYGEHSHTKKGLKMCAFILYAFGSINYEIDKALWNSTYNYLLFATRLGDAKEYDKIILDVLRNMVSDANDIPAYLSPDNNVCDTPYFESGLMDCEDNKHDEIPLWERYLFTIAEAAEFYHLDENRLHKIVEDYPNCCFIIMNGNEALIHRKHFESYLNNTTQI